MENIQKLIKYMKDKLGVDAKLYASSVSSDGLTYFDVYSLLDDEIRVLHFLDNNLIKVQIKNKYLEKVFYDIEKAIPFIQSEIKEIKNKKRPYKIWIETHKLTFSIHGSVFKYNDDASIFEEKSIEKRTMIFKKPALKKLLKEVENFIMIESGNKAGDYINENEPQWLDILESYPN